MSFYFIVWFLSCCFYHYYGNDKNVLHKKKDFSFIVLGAFDLLAHIVFSIIRKQTWKISDPRSNYELGDRFPISLIYDDTELTHVNNVEKLKNFELFTS